MVTSRGELVYRTLETVEDMGFSGKRDLKCFVVGVTANLAGGHVSAPPIDCHLAETAGRLKSERKNGGAAVPDMMLASMSSSRGSSGPYARFTVSRCVHRVTVHGRKVHPLHSVALGSPPNSVSY